MHSRSLRHVPDLVIAVRVVLAFVVLGLLSLSLPFAVAGVLLTVVVIAMDGLDGYLARRLGIADELGAVLDITGDRIVEHVFWIFFAVAGVVPLWVPLVIVTRSFAVDTVRGMAFKDGMTAFGDKTMMRSSLSRFLVSSRFMRNAYGAAKVVAFVLLGVVIVLETAGAEGMSVGERAQRTLELVTFVVVLLTVGLNVLRGIPVVWDGMPLLQALRSESGQ